MTGATSISRKTLAGPSSLLPFLLLSFLISLIVIFYHSYKFSFSRTFSESNALPEGGGSAPRYRIEEGALDHNYIKKITIKNIVFIFINIGTNTVYDTSSGGRKASLKKYVEYKTLLFSPSFPFRLILLINPVSFIKFLYCYYLFYFILELFHRETRASFWARAPTAT